MAEIQAGDRVLIAKQRATVRYLGPVDGHDGIWAGVEWDDSSRGKHDGATGGRRYFSCCSAAPTAASFIRIHKVAPGASLVESLILRYTNQLAEGQGGLVDAQQAYVSTASNKKLWVELVGQEQVTARQSKLELLTSARLVGANVSSVGPAGRLAASVPSLQQLDLTDNLISNWGTVASICEELPHLQLLNLSLNRLQLSSSLPDAGLQQLPGLQCLVLNQCNITWQQVAVLQSSLPHLQELHAAGNNISSLGVQQDHTCSPRQQQQQQEEDWPPLVGFTTLKVLGLEDNTINSWQEVLRLAGLPSLQRLALSGNHITSITLPGGDVSPAALFSSSPPDTTPVSEQHQQQELQHAAPLTACHCVHVDHGQQAGQPPFAHLKALLLGDCSINSWADVDQLNKLPALCELRLSGNPLCSAEGGGPGAGRRFEVIGRVSGLTLLNGADVKPRERRDCELRYLQNVLAEQAEAGASGNGQQQQLMRQHPRLAELQGKYGQVSAVAPVNPSSRQQGSSLSSTTCELLLQCGSSTAKKKLPKTVTVAALKLLCSRLFKLAPNQIQLQLLQSQDGPCVTTQDPTSSQELQPEDIGQDETKQLSFWDVADGSTVLITHVHPEQQRQQREAEQLQKMREHDDRMAQQLQQGEVLRTAADSN